MMSLSSEESIYRKPYPGHVSAFQGDRLLTKKRLSRILVTLYLQRDGWKKYGRLKVFCKEFFILAPVQLWWWMAETFLIGTTILLFYMLLPHQWVLLIFGAFLALLELMAFYKTCFKDPGILPRPDFLTSFQNLLKLISTWESGKGLVVNRVVSFSNGMSEHQSYCWKCHQYRNFSTSHCGTCDCCMIKQDHHCPVYGGCVARNNLKAFHVMVATMICFWLYVLAYSIYGAVSTDDFEIPQVGVKKGERVFDHKILLYVVLLEIGAVVVIPPIIHCFIEMFRKKPSKSMDSEVEAALNSGGLSNILAFAHENNLTVEEINVIKSVFELDIRNPSSSRSPNGNPPVEKSNGQDNNQNFHTESE